MKLLLPQPFPLLRRNLCYVDWVLLAVSALLAILSTYYDAFDRQIQAQLAGFHGVFFLLSLITPMEQSLDARRKYVFSCMAVFVIAAAFNFRFDLLMYWTIAKSCLLLPLKEVAAATFLLGVGYLAGLTWSLPGRIERTLAMITEQGATGYFAPSKLMFYHFTFYLGASSFAIVVGYLLIAERKSRLQAEALTQEVEQLAATLERNRIARDIHDSLGHSLTALQIQLEVAQKLREHDPNQALQALDLAKLLSGECLQDVRRSLQTLHRSPFDLQQALVTLVAQVKQHQSFQVRLDMQLPSLPLQTSHQLYCIVQEGLTNIQKHADATLVEVRAQFSDREVVLELMDDGKGFDLSQPHTGFGLRGMQERVQLLGGQIELHTAPSQGTVIHITIPR
ncbi:sensor histidine kinase [Phormidium sp. FACHB-592]|uniref:Oxygen sensor histidine kinase NreB n=1 Tax=Stenomitos frigidus AS-A4 TaxID=2933935 RepID=A0ABV0KUE5_9CYAN|nr:sensor histidine kinase [Phormidium sp. FACHB-592]MBD2075816.1 sensor histidine kinase [Phormidium sp. FACHB-592]